MKHILTTPLERMVMQSWQRVDPVQKTAFVIIIAVSLLAFGFEMTNLTFHHDDVAYIFVDDDRIGRSLGRFGFGWVHYYTQNAYIMPFLQLVQAIVLMALCGIVVARLWELNTALDVALVSLLLCVFPYMAQMYQYNFCQVPFAIAHLLAAVAAFLSTRGKAFLALVAAALYALTFSIYQAVLANAVTLLAFWFLVKTTFHGAASDIQRASTLRQAFQAISALVVGGLLYVAWVSLSGKAVSSYQSADEAFRLRPSLDPTLIAALLNQGSRSFFIWPESYFPGYVKQLQLVLVMAAALVCAWAPQSWGKKLAALLIFVLALLAPRTLHLLHPGGHFHNLTLTAYAVAVAGSLMILLRGCGVFGRNMASLVALAVIAGYILQCNWISTINHLNTMAHFSQATQILARARSVPDSGWDGRTIAVAGSLPLFSGYPFRKTMGVASDFLSPTHLQYVTHLLRDNVNVIAITEAGPNAQATAATLPPWPHPDSVRIIDGVAVVALGQASSGRDSSIR